MIKRLLVVPVLCLLFFFTGVMAFIAWPYFSFRYDVAFLLTKQSVLHVTAWRWAFYLHISTSVLVLLTGGLQFVKHIQEHYPAAHRLLGKVYVFTLLVISAPSGLIMALYANGGIWAKVSFVLISVLWWSFTLKGLIAIRGQNILLHKIHMMRSYALTLSAITLRLYVLFLPAFTNLHGKDMYVLVAWLSWVPNLLVAEFLIWRWKQQRF
jgi:hypothetical protein